MLCPLAAFFLLDTAYLRTVFHVSHNGKPRKQCRILKDHAAIRTGPGDILAHAENVPRRGHLKACNQVQDGTLTALSGAEQHKELIFAHLNIQISNDLIAAFLRFVEKLIHTTELDQRLASSRYFPLTVHAHSLDSTPLMMVVMSRPVRAIARMPTMICVILPTS